MNQQVQSATMTYMNGQDRIPAVPRFRLDYKAFSYLHQLLRFRSTTTAPERSRFASRLALHFPDIAARIDENDFGVLHLEVGEVKLATRQAIANRDWLTVNAHFAFMSDLLGDAGAELSNAIHVSYLGNLFYTETSINYAKARCMLPKPLAAALEKIEQHYEHLVL